MNIYINLNDIKENRNINLYDNIRYLYPKKNTIMDGEFTKILYSKYNVTLNGLYIYLPINIEKTNSDSHVRCISSTSNNITIMQDLKNLKLYILNNFKSYSKRNKIFEPVISNQLNTNTIRVYHDNNNSNKKRNKYVIKISGIWETIEKIGLTYKILEL